MREKRLEQGPSPKGKQGEEKEKKKTGIKRFLPRGNSIDGNSLYSMAALSRDEEATNSASSLYAEYIKVRLELEQRLQHRAKRFLLLVYALLWKYSQFGM
jgi:hypothetical protein